LSRFRTRSRILVRRQAGGLSLLETVIALFLFTAAALVTVALFHSALHRTTKIQQGATARLVAEEAVAEMRAEFAESSYGTKDPDSFKRNYPVPDHPGFQVDIQADWAQLQSPSNPLNLELPATQRKVMDRSAIRTEVTVSWNEGRDTYSLVTLIEEPTTELDRVRITGPGGTLAARATQEYQAIGEDANGNVIEDLTFLWWVEPMSGTGTVTANHAEGKGILVNEAQIADGTTVVAPGSMRLKVVSKYRGKEVAGNSATIQLLP
jgi:Tfp pilus assembly protein PilV